MVVGQRKYKRSLFVICCISPDHCVCNRPLVFEWTVCSDYLTHICDTYKKHTCLLSEMLKIFLYVEVIFTGAKQKFGCYHLSRDKKSDQFLGIILWLDDLRFWKKLKYYWWWIWSNNLSLRPLIPCNFALWHIILFLGQNLLIINWCIQKHKIYLIMLTVLRHYVPS